MSDQPLSEDKRSGTSNLDDAPELISDTPPSTQQQEEKPAEDSGSESGSADRAMTQAEIDALLASLGGD